MTLIEVMIFITIFSILMSGIMKLTFEQYIYSGSLIQDVDIIQNQD